MSVICRQATHAGSWYSESSSELGKQLDDWLQLVGVPSLSPAKGIISPHAGYRYSGSTAAFAFKQIDPERVNKIFILGPCHKVHIEACALSTASKYKTPVGDLIIDEKIYNELKATELFETMEIDDDEDEHSLELQLPYIARVMSQKTNGPFTIVPIMVGSLANDAEEMYGKVLAKYLAQDGVCFVISSDFCHWGSRFRYVNFNKEHGEIWQSIEKLDHDSMEIIESLDPKGFQKYLAKTGNTICGRHPIAVFLFSCVALQASGYGIRCKFLKYAQSSRARKFEDSSVSYASASFVSLQN